MAIFLYLLSTKQDAQKQDCVPFIPFFRVLESNFPYYTEFVLLCQAGHVNNYRVFYYEPALLKSFVRITVQCELEITKLFVRIGCSVELEG